jgi:Glycosyl transferase family 2
VTAPDLGRHPPAEAYDADILILTLDRLTETEAALRSAVAQVGLTRRVILLDQGSAPETWQRLAALVAEREDALLVSAGGNLGVAEGRNRAAALGLGRVIIALDNDAVFADATTAARAVAVLDLRPDLAAIGFRIMNGDGSGEDEASWGYPEGLRPQAAGRFDCATFVGAGHAIRRSAWEEVGGYDARLFFTWEEFDFSLRAIQAGWRLLYTGDIAVHHALAAERSRLVWPAMVPVHAQPALYRPEVAHALAELWPSRAVLLGQRRPAWARPPERGGDHRKLFTGARAAARGTEPGRSCLSPGGRWRSARRVVEEALAGSFDRLSRQVTTSATQSRCYKTQVTVITD